MNDGRKLCRGCQQRKPFSNFYYRRGKPNGQCKVCVLDAAHRCWLHASAAQKARHRASCRKSYQKHRAHKLAHEAEFRAQYPERRLATLDKYRATHPDRDRASKQAYLLKHPDRRRESAHRRYLKSKDKYYGYVRDRLARRVAAPGTFTFADVRCQFDVQGGRCYWCSRPLDRYHADHVIPLSRGGSNYPDNIVVACPSCNGSKHNKLAYSEWQPPNPLWLVDVQPE